MIILLLLFNQLFAIEKPAITADKLKQDFKKGVSAFCGNVNIKFKYGVIRSDTAIYYEKEEKIKASGNVEASLSIERREINGKSDEIVYSLQQRSLILSGNPRINLKITIDNATYFVNGSADEINVDLDKHKVEFKSSTIIESEDIGFKIYSQNAIYDDKEQQIIFWNKDAKETTRVSYRTYEATSGYVKVSIKDRTLCLKSDVFIKGEL